MDPITFAIVSGLASGVAAEITQKIISLLSRRSNKLEKDLNALEATPTSEVLQNRVSTEIEKLITSQDEEILELSRQLLSSIERQEPSNLNKAGITLKDVKAANIEIAKLTSSDGEIRLEGIRASGDFKLGEVSVRRSDPKG